MTLLMLAPDELLSTTHGVRKRLDCSLPVSDELVRECVERAVQSPSGSNNMTLQRLSPLAFTTGTDFKPAARPAADSIIHWDQW